MRRIVLLTAASSAVLAAAVPAAAPAAHPCVASPGVETCETLVSENKVVGERYSVIKHYATHPEDIIVCVRECGPPTD